MIIVTGAAGFIGSCLVAKLNEMGHHDLIVVDHYDDDHDPKHRNLKGKRYQRYYDKKEFIKLIRRQALDLDVKAIFHMGACSSTTVSDSVYVEENNVKFSCELIQWGLAQQARIIYASSAATYGDGRHGYGDNHQDIPLLQPLNLYGQSKQDVDLWVLKHQYEKQIVGLKFFNVFGPNEYHKDDMRSVVAKSFDQVMKEGKMVLFQSHHPDYRDGEQKRDFIYVKDVVDVMIYFWKNVNVNGIFNVGCGQARTWNDLARALFMALERPVQIDYIPMPDILRNKYQYFTEARVEKLRQSGYTKPFTSLEDAVKDYVAYLKTSAIW